MVNLELYRVFYTVAKCGSLTKAAEELYISQPAVSQSIKQLENQLGVRLFNRTHKGMELSAQGGQLIFDEVEQALELLNAAENRMSEMRTSASGLIRIGASDTIFEYFLADKIVDFHERFPSVKIELMADFTPDTIEKLKANRCDVAFVNLPIEVDEALSLQGNCMRLNDIFIAGEKYKDLANGDTVLLADLKKYPLIMMDKHTVARRALDNFLGAHGVDLQPSIEVGSWDLMKRLVIRGMGIGIIPREYAMDGLDADDLYEVQTDPALPTRSVGMLLPKNTHVSYALHSFLEFVKKGN
ncbi:MAG: LysR family transcriptional regulator [Clostridiales bacterium]|nr:LysR family transcriptional regulator [Clostridiales bacterium]